MSRRAFRVAVDDPRPAAAWVMVALAGATLWITGQLDPWAWGAQSVAIALSWWRRLDAFRWQSNPWILNVGMLAIVTGTIAVALRGEPSTVALAHFAAPAQGLQLLDARPRRTEYLLVTLALFQVVLAANLTDNVFFTPLLLGFVLATVWTLIVHTLRSEALEAGCGRELSGAFTPGLLGTCGMASLLSVVLALVLFVTLPRLRTHVVRGPVGGGVLASAGFSDRVEFGELGRIRRDPTVVMRVETLEGEPPAREQAYWRGLGFEHFDGRTWSVDGRSRRWVPGSAEAGVSFTRSPDDYDLVQRIVREPVASGVLFRLGEPRSLQGTVRRLERDDSGGLYAAGQADERVRYVVRTARRRPDDRSLRRDRALAPEGRVWEPLEGFSPAVAALAEQLVAGAPSDADRARAIEAHLLRHGRYSDSPPEAEDSAEDSPIERFLLGDMAGHCEYFASAMVVLARQVGLPARLVNGFAGGRTNAIGGFVELTRSDAHAWVEIHFEHTGWVRYDPTPADLRARGVPPASLWSRARDLASAVELWWFQRVVGFDRSDQMGALKRLWLAWRAARAGPSARASEAPQTPDRVAWRSVLERRELLLAAVAVGGMALSAGWLGMRRRRSARVHAGYERAVRLLARRGIRRRPSDAPRAFARRAAGALPPPAARAFGDLTEAYLRERFAERPANSQGALQRFERELRRRRAA